MNKTSVKLIAWALLSLCFTVKAQTPSPTPPASAELTFTPSKLSVAAVRGDSPSRQILFSANAAADFKIIALDLTRGDDTMVIPASAIVITPDKGKIGTGDSQKVAVGFNLAGAPGGEFNGELRVQHSGGKLSIPLTVKIKHRFLWPLLTLIFGVGLSMLLNWYRDQGKPRDEVQVRAAQLRAELKAETDLGKAFLDRINIALIDLDVALRAQKWEDARKQIEQAEEVIAKWRRHRDDWRRQLDFAESLLKKIGEAKDKSISSGENVYLRVLGRNLEDAIAQAPDVKSPAGLRDKLDGVNSDFAEYQSTRRQLDELAGMLGDLDAQARREWDVRLRRLHALLEAMTPESVESFKQLQTDIAQAGSELQNAQPGVGSFNLSAKSANEPLFIQLGLNAPGLLLTGTDTAVDEATQAERAGRNLLWFSRLLIVVSLILLVGAGYIQLYESKPTFGANCWADYFGLFVWGFGVEASRSAVTDWLKGFNLSLWK
ncbi:MAG TPA: hypothetical protein PLD20_29385 [Blastocatellia bacterium]|nr:hypothetical protein [Blastocatellia bacterium]HNG28423.1 hypothetical protein [Blastocatellia bacterium]